jgi:hypothetical protein
MSDEDTLAATPGDDPTVNLDQTQEEITAEVEPEADTGNEPEKAENDARMADLEYHAKQQELAQKQRLAEVEYQIKLTELAIKQRGIEQAEQKHELGMVQAGQNMMHTAERHRQQQEQASEPAE